MSELENALRNALAKGDATSAEFRHRVYRAAATALERRLADSLEAGDEVPAVQKKKLADAIRSVETGYRPVAPEAPDPSADRASPEIRVEPRGGNTSDPKGNDAFAALRAEPRIEPEKVRPADAEGRQKKVRRRAPFAILLTVSVALALVVIGGWWVVSTGAFQSAEQRDTSVPNPPLQLDNESFKGARDPGTATAPARLNAAETDNEGWIVLFDPADPTTVSLSGGATASIDGDAFGDFALIASPKSQSQIVIDIPPGVLESLAGRTAQFNIIAQSGGDVPTQMSVECTLAELGDCGRRRFRVAPSENEFLFHVELPATSRVSGAGRLILVTDIDDTGKAVKLTSIRVREL